MIITSHFVFHDIRNAYLFTLEVALCFKLYMQIACMLAEFNSKKRNPLTRAKRILNTLHLQKLLGPTKKQKILLVSGRSPECSDCLLKFYGEVITLKNKM